MLKFIEKEVIVFKKYKLPIVVLLWIFVAALAAILEISRGLNYVNNFFIFKGVFHHTIQQLPLYELYPQEYEDKNHYGPLFSLVIAPFTFLPNTIAIVFWNISNASFLLLAIYKLSVSKKYKLIILSIGLIEMMTAAHNVQFNSMLTGWIILSYVFVKEEKDIWAALFVVAGFFVKLYGIVGLFFWIFSKHKIKYIGYGLMWLLLLFCLPMIISSPNFIIQSYQDWFDTLVVKNSKNSVGEQNGFMQDISVMGMIRRIFFIKNFSNIYVLIPAAIAYVTVVTQFKKYVLQIFQLQCVAFALIGSVIFSSSAESPTFIIAMMGVGIWYCSSATSTFNKSILTFAIIFTSLSATDIVPFYIRENFIKPYSLKALPCFVVWCLLWYSLVFEKSNSNTVNNKLL